MCAAKQIDNLFSVEKEKLVLVNVYVDEDKTFYEKESYKPIIYIYTCRVICNITNRFIHIKLIIVIKTFIKFFGCWIL